MRVGGWTNQQTDLSTKIKQVVRAIFLLSSLYLVLTGGTLRRNTSLRHLVELPLVRTQGHGGAVVPFLVGEEMGRELGT